jgi:hypothetical protein
LGTAPGDFGGRKGDGFQALVGPFGMKVNLKELSMKYFVIILMIAISQASAFAAPQPTPVSGRLVAKTPMDKLTIRLRQQNIQISRDLKAGKLTKDQAKTLKGQVEAIRKAELADLKADNSKTLTDAQIANLNEQLNTLSKSIPIR